MREAFFGKRVGGKTDGLGSPEALEEPGCRVKAGVLSGQIRGAPIARQFGVSRSWTSGEANAPGTRILIAKLLDRDRRGVVERRERSAVTSTTENQALSTNRAEECTGEPALN